MKTNKFSDEKIMYAIKLVESSSKVADVCREYGISHATFYKWKNKYAGMSISDVKKLRLVEQENIKLKKLVAELMLDKHMLQEVIAKKL